MGKFLESVNIRHLDRRISEVVERLEEKQLYGTINLIKDLRYCLDLATKEKTHDCNCQHNSNSRDNEPCCRCDSKHTNADRIRNMSDEELASVLFSGCIDSMDFEECPFASESELDNNIREICKKCVLEWLQSEAE